MNPEVGEKKKKKPLKQKNSPNVVMDEHKSYVLDLHATYFICVNW